MKTHCLFLAVCLVMLGNKAHAQLQEKNEYRDYNSTEQRLVEEIGLERLPNTSALPGSLDVRNIAQLVQRGDDNTAIATQRNFGALANQIAILQVGDFNEAVITQNGSNNRVAARQSGSSNKIENDVTGNNNRTDLVQEGSGNQIFQQYTANDQVYNITQLGSDNVLEQRGIMPQATAGYNVEMRGNGIQITVEQNRLP